MQGLGHDAIKGTRIGEASNPGPGPKLLQQLLGGLDIKSILRDLLKQLLQEVASGQSGAGLLAALNQKPRKRKTKHRNKLSRALGGSGATPNDEPRTLAPSAPAPKAREKTKAKAKAKVQVRVVMEARDGLLQSLAQVTDGLQLFANSGL